jgi:hypothetical protein
MSHPCHHAVIVGRYLHAMTDVMCPDERAVLLIERLRGLFDDQPALRLTTPQIQRILGSSPNETAAVLEQLVQQRYLRRCADGYVTRARVMRIIPLPRMGDGGRWVAPVLRFPQRS